MLEILKELGIPEPEKQVEKIYERGLIPEIRRYGLRDAFPSENRSWTIPTEYASKGSKVGTRLDYFFVSDDIKVKRTEVLRNNYTEKASDHYPIVMVFEI